MNDSPADSIIEFAGVGKSYSLALHRGGGIKNLILNPPQALRNMRAHSRVVLDDFSLRIGRGESIAVMGRNGAGKSTLLSLIAGVIRPTTGTLAVNGSVSPLLELGAGFHPELTGRDNVMLNGVLVGNAAVRGGRAHGPHRRISRSWTTRSTNRCARSPPA